MGTSTHNLLTPTEVARLLIVSPVTVRHWSQQGKLKARLTPGGHRRYSLEEVSRFALEHGIDIKRQLNERSRVLVISAESGLFNHLQECLASVAGQLSLAQAANGFEAGLMLHRFKPELIVLDVDNVKLEPIEVIRQLKADASMRNIHLIVFASDCSKESITLALRHGADACMSQCNAWDKILTPLGITQ